MPVFEREFWQATVQFSRGAGVETVAAARLLTELSALPLDGMQWALPGMIPDAGFQYEVGAEGVTQLPPDFVAGTSQAGWVIRLGATQLIVRHQQMIANGMRRLRPEQFPDPNRFASLVTQVVDLLPSTLVANRVGLTGNYAAFVGGQFPPSVVSRILGLDDAVASPPPDNRVFTTSHNEVEFEVIDGRRFVWNDIVRAGNWFDTDGLLLRESAIVRTLDLKTAQTEPAHPLPVGFPSPELPPMPRNEVVTFLGATALPKLLGRLARRLPPEFTVNE